MPKVIYDTRCQFMLSEGCNSLRVLRLTFKVRCDKLKKKVFLERDYEDKCQHGLSFSQGRL